MSVASQIPVPMVPNVVMLVWPAQVVEIRNPLALASNEVPFSLTENAF
jgi:hypothetical protein